MTPDEMREVAALHSRMAGLLTMAADAREACDREVEAHHATRSEARQAARDVLTERAEATRLRGLLKCAESDLQEKANSVQVHRRAYEEAAAERDRWKQVAADGTEKVVRIAARIRELEAQLAAGGAA